MYVSVCACVTGCEGVCACACFSLYVREGERGPVRFIDV